MEAVMQQLIREAGTPESCWQAWLASRPLRTVPASRLLETHRRAVIVAPHPDDEVLGATAVLRHCAQSALPCIVVAVTDGDASHPASPAWPRERLAQVRAQESAMALAILAPGTQVIRLRLPDGQIAAQAARLVEILAGILQPGDAIFCTWRHDGQPDHDATGTACAMAARRHRCPLFELPISTWHWAFPNDARVPWRRAVALPLTPQDLDLKREAVACFRSQLLPDRTTGRAAILPPWVTTRLLRPFEMVMR